MFVACIKDVRDFGVRLGRNFGLAGREQHGPWQLGSPFEVCPPWVSGDGDVNVAGREILDRLYMPVVAGGVVDAF